MLMTIGIYIYIYNVLLSVGYRKTYIEDMQKHIYGKNLS